MFRYIIISTKHGPQYDWRKILDRTTVKTRPDDAVTFVNNHQWAVPSDQSGYYSEAWHRHGGYSSGLFQLETGSYRSLSKSDKVWRAGWVGILHLNVMSWLLDFGKGGQQFQASNLRVDLFASLRMTVSLSPSLSRIPQSSNVTWSDVYYMRPVP
jgi:hypothetical protein